MSKLSYLLVPVSIILLIFNAIFYSKINTFKKENLVSKNRISELENKILKANSGNIFNNLTFSAPKITPANWKTYRSDKYGIEFEYPPRYGSYEVKIDEGNPSDYFDIRIHHEKGFIMGINVYKEQSPSREETKKSIEDLIVRELENRNDAYLQNSQEIIISPDITAYKVSFLTRAMCKTEKIGYENLFSYYIIDDYKQNSSAFINMEHVVESNQCPPDEPIIPYYQSKEVYQNEFRQYIYDDQIISTFRFIN